MRQATSKTVMDAFDGKLKKKSYVPFKTKYPSLGGVILPAQNVKFFKKDGKLRVNLLDHDASEYDLRVTCKYLRDVLDPMSSKDFESFNKEMQGSGKKRVFALAWQNPMFIKTVIVI